MRMNPNHVNGVSSQYLPLKIEKLLRLTTSMDFRIVGQYFFAAAPPPPNVYFPDESVCSASPAMFKCDISA